MNPPQADTTPSETRQAWATPVVCDLDIRKTANGGSGFTDASGTRDGS